LRDEKQSEQLDQRTLGRIEEADRILDLSKTICSVSHFTIYRATLLFLS